MANYSLQPNEAVVMSVEGVTYGNRNYAVHELLLTTENLVFIKKGTFGNTKDFIVYPLNQVKVFNGKAQALVLKQSKLDVYLLNETISFGIGSKRTANRLAENINHLVTGSVDDIQVASNLSNSIPGAEAVAETLKDTLDTFKGVFGKKTNEKLDTNCSSCGASISGTAGQMVKCPYCGTNQQL